MLRNKPIKVARERQDSYLFIQGPTIGQIYEDDKLFMAVQILMMPEKELKDFLNLKDTSFDKLQLLTLLVTEYKEKETLINYFSQIILGLKIKNDRIFIDTQLLKLKEVSSIQEILQTIMGQKAKPSKEEKELSPQEKRLLELEEKINRKKNQKQEEKLSETDENHIENIMVAVMYEFGFDFEKIMDMNYFTLIWFYSYTSKLHVYRINQFAIGSGMVKKINSDYFTSLK
jgi:hypothetical protein